MCFIIFLCLPKRWFAFPFTCQNKCLNSILTSTAICLLSLYETTAVVLGYLPGQFFRHTFSDCRGQHSCTCPGCRRGSGQQCLVLHCTQRWMVLEGAACRKEHRVQQTHGGRTDGARPAALSCTLARKMQPFTSHPSEGKELP